MGNCDRPGSVVVGEYDHDPFGVNGENYLIREIRWNRIAERSYDLIRIADNADLTVGGSFGSHPTDAQIADVLSDHGVEVAMETCAFCDCPVLRDTAHRHQRGWVGDSCCWDDRLRATE